MPLTLKLTSQMAADEIAPYWEDILRCFQKYVDRFPEHETVENMLAEVISGKRQLWIVLDETGKVILSPVTEISTLPTGKKILTLAEVGGDRLQDALPLLEQIEQWASNEHDVTEAQFPGRVGYRKLLIKYNYREQTAIFTKPLEKKT